MAKARRWGSEGKVLERAVTCEKKQEMFQTEPKSVAFDLTGWRQGERWLPGVWSCCAPGSSPGDPVCFAEGRGHGSD